MQKYLAVIKDSFREAMASRVLWLVLVLTTLLLLAIAPLGYQEEVTWRLRDEDVREWPDLMQLVRTEGKDGEHRIASYLWNRLDGDVQRRLEQAKIPGIDQDAANPFEFIRAFGAFRESINGMLKERDFYDESALADVSLLSQEVRDLRDEGPDNLSEDSLRRFNRLVMEAALPQLIRPSPPVSIQLRYAWLNVGPAFPLRGETLKESIQSLATQGMNWFIGAIGISIAILVTAPIIPQMFDQGSLHLLLSKPLSRWLLFLSKFLGGCAFILVAASYLIFGFWLILGMRFGVWDPKLLWSIPIYLFVFAIYYSVSALVGLIWRSPIVSIALTILFWISCFLVGTTKVAFETTFWNKARWTRVLDVNGDLMAVNETGLVHRWNADSTDWDEVFVSDEQRQARGILIFMPTIPREMRPVGPLYLPNKRQLISIQPTLQRTQKLYVGQSEDDWEATSNLSAPVGSLAIFREPTGSVLIVSSMGIFRLKDDPLEKKEPITFFNWEIPVNLGSAYRKVSPEPPVLLTQPASVAMHPESGDLCLYTRGTLVKLALKADGQYQSVGDALRLDGEELDAAVLALAGSTLLVGREDGRIQVRDAASLELQEELQPSGGDPPRFITAAEDGKHFAIVLHNGELWVFDQAKGAMQKAAVSGQGDISFAGFRDSETLLVADQTVRVSSYRVGTGELVDRYSPKLGLLAASYRYGIVPLYTLFPKPGELDKTIQFLLSGKDTESQSGDLSVAQRELDPWTPLWSSAVFTIVVLFIGCVYVEWQDF